MNRAAVTPALLPRDTAGEPAPSLPQAAFDDLYSAVYEILDDAKTSHNLVKLYKGSHAATQPHPAVLDFGTSFLSGRRGLLGYACRAVNPEGPPAIADLEHFDRTHDPRISTRAAFDLLLPGLRRCGESDQDVLAYVASRIHPLGAYRGGSSGLDDETRAFAAAHFRSTGLNVTPEDVLVFCGGAKGALHNAASRQPGVRPRRRRIRRKLPGPWTRRHADRFADRRRPGPAAARADEQLEPERCHRVEDLRPADRACRVRGDHEPAAASRGRPLPDGVLPGPGYS